MIKIYKIIKKADLNSIYVGKTTLTLGERFSCHKRDSKKFPNRKVYTWFDSTCKIVLIEDYNGDKPRDREYEIINEYIAQGYIVYNDYDGKTFLDETYYENMKNKSNARYTAEYHRWRSNICNKAKKEGLTSKEYRIKYNIEYTGLKYS